MAHFLRVDKWSTFETGKLLGHIAFLDFKQCFFGGQSKHVDENLHTAPLLPVRKLRGITGTDLFIEYVTQSAVFAPFQSNMAWVRKTAAPSGAMASWLCGFRRRVQSACLNRFQR